MMLEFMSPITGWTSVAKSLTEDSLVGLAETARYLKGTLSYWANVAYVLEVAVDGDAITMDIDAVSRYDVVRSWLLLSSR